MAKSDNDISIMEEQQSPTTAASRASARKRKRADQEEAEEKEKDDVDDALLASVVADTLQDSTVLMEAEEPAAAAANNSTKKTWMDYYNKLVDYSNQYGSTEVPQRYKGVPGLGSWCKNQREYYKRITNNQTSSLTEERIALLNKIGFAWVSTKTKRKVVKDFDVHLAELQQFKDLHSHTRVPHVYDENPGLGVFCHRVKIYYREMQEGKRKTPNDWLTPERIEALDNLQFEWKVGRWKGAPSWEERYAQLVEHKDRTGHCNVSKEYDEQHAPGLKAWITNQRTYLNRVPSKEKRVKSAVVLSQEKITALKSLGVDFAAPTSTGENEKPAAAVEEDSLAAYDSVPL